MFHLLAAYRYLFSCQASIFLRVSSVLNILFCVLWQFVQSCIKLFHRACLFGSALRQWLRAAWELFRMPGYLTFSLINIAKRSWDGSGKAVNGFLNGFKITNIRLWGMYVKITWRQHAHNPVDIFHILVDLMHGILDCNHQISQFIILFTFQFKL